MQDIRNIAIIAHVDHGKTTLVDRMIYQANLVRKPEDLGNLILDNNDLERERGITILAKNVSVTYKGVKINIIDTPGHSDFGGEVERVLNMADGVLLLVDAFEGCMPQTRFVLNKALDMGKKPIVVINKVDKPNCRPDEVQEEVFELMFNLGATEDQLDFKTIYGSAKQGWMSKDWKQPTNDITALLDTILEEIPAPAVVEGTPQMLVSSLEYSPYVGRIAVGRVTRGSLKTGMPVSLCKRYDIVEKSKIKQVMVFEGLGKANVDEVQCGDICALVGIDGFEIGDTIADIENPEALPPIAVDEPTMSMLFMINNSPFFGRDGKFVTSRHIKERLEKELEKNLALRVKPGLNAARASSCRSASPRCWTRPSTATAASRSRNSPSRFPSSSWAPPSRFPRAARPLSCGWNRAATGRCWSSRSRRAASWAFAPTSSPPARVRRSSRTASRTTSPTRATSKCAPTVPSSPWRPARPWPIR